MREAIHLVRCEHLLDLVAALALNERAEGDGVESVSRICLAATQTWNDKKISGKPEESVS